jgi:DNA-binding transcriptional LysR family regulator
MDKTMQLKWLEDFLALAQTRSFSRAAELRHVTHPAFGRRIKALEDWSGSALVERGSSPVCLTPAGERLFDDARDLVHGIEQARDALQGAAGRRDLTVTLATGRTLARTLVADWLVHLTPVLNHWLGEFHVRTRSLVETTGMLERGEVDFMLTYHHALLAVQLNARQYTHVTLTQDRLVPVTRSDASGQRFHQFDASIPTPYLAYAPSLAMARLVADHLANHPQAPHLRRIVECDSVDALLEYALKGVGVAWLPWSLVTTACKDGRLAVLGDVSLVVAFEVRLYRSKRRLGPFADAVWKQITTSV